MRAFLFEAVPGIKAVGTLVGCRNVQLHGVQLVLLRPGIRVFHQPIRHIAAPVFLVHIQPHNFGPAAVLVQGRVGMYFHQHKTHHLCAYMCQQPGAFIAVVGLFQVYGDQIRPIIHQLEAWIERGVVAMQRAEQPDHVVGVTGRCFADHHLSRGSHAFPSLGAAL